MYMRYHLGPSLPHHFQVSPWAAHDDNVADLPPANHASKHDAHWGLFQVRIRE